MAYPKKADGEKAVRQDISMQPELLKRLIAYCETEERGVSWVARKAIDEWLTARGF